MMIWRIVLGIALALTVVGSVTSCARDGKELIQAATEGDIATVTTLLAQGADVNAKDHEGFPALMRACQEGRPEVVQALNARGAKEGRL